MGGNSHDKGVAGMSFQGKVAMVTGMAAGIGRTLTERLLAEGAIVVGLDIAPEAELGLDAAAGQFHYCRADVTRKADVDAAFDLVAERYGRLDILVNNVGGYWTVPPFEEIAEEDWDRVIDLNLKSVFLTCQRAVAIMKRQRSGRIVNLASIAGRHPVTLSHFAYAAAKAGVVGLTKHLALALGPYNITVNAVSPITTLTPRVRQVRKPETQAQIVSRIPLGKLAEPEDSVNAILFLASDAAGFLTGLTIDVTGGAYMS